MSREILLLVDALAREKNVNRDIVFGALELALLRPPRSVSRTTSMSGSASITNRAISRAFAGGRSFLTRKWSFLPRSSA